MSLHILLSAFLAVVGSTTQVVAAEAWRPLTVAVEGGIVDLVQTGGGMLVKSRSQVPGQRFGHHRIHLQGDLPVLEFLQNFSVAPQERRRDMLPDGIVIYGRRGIAECWLVGPTNRYRHGVLGDAIEASGVRAVDRDGRLMSFDLSEDSVFEDRLARLADPDGDGRDEILVVRSYLTRGSSLTVLKAECGALTVVAETVPIGLPHRWLNPVGVGDFDGDSRPEIALVITPHIGGVLEIYQLEGNRFSLEASAKGFSNHAMGSRELGLSAMFEANGDGIVDLALPDAQRRRLRVVSFADGAFRDIFGVPHKAAIATAIHVVDMDKDGVPELVYGLADGVLVVLRH